MVTATSSNERMAAMGIHIGVIALAVMTSWAAGIAGVVAAGIIMLIKPLNSEFVQLHAKEAFNFNLTMFILAMIAVGLFLFTLGIGIIIILPLALLIGAAWIICSGMAAIAGYEGREYRYPLSIRFVR